MAASFPIIGKNAGHFSNHWKILLVGALLAAGTGAWGQIWINPLTCGPQTVTNALGHTMGNYYWNFEIGQASWNSSQVGIGYNPDGSGGWSWADALWYEHGEGSNERVRRDLAGFQFTATGRWYVVCQARANAGDTYTTASACGWTNGTAWINPPASYFTIVPIPKATVFYARTNTASPSTSIDLSWTNPGTYQVMIVRKQGAPVDAPVNGHGYALGETYSGSNIVVRTVALGTSFTDTGLAENTKYYYGFFAENYSYYAEVVATNATTATGGGGVPPAPGVLPASATNANSFTAAWSAAAGATNYLLDVGSTMDFSAYISGYQNRSVGNATSHSVTGLSASATYYYRVRAANASGTSGNSATQAVTTTSQAFAPGNSWHVPANAEPAGAFMRNPPTNGVMPGTAVYFYNGTYTVESDQTGGTLYYRKVGGATWTSTNLAWDSNAGNNQYWIAPIPGGTFSSTNVVEYYFRITYNNADVTWLGSTNNVWSEKYQAEGNAQAHPFTFTYGTSGGSANFANCWHFPTNAEPSGAHMRNPVAPAASQAAYIYNGGYSLEGNQTGGTLYYRKTGAGAWNNTNLAFDVQAGDNKYWVAPIPAATYTNGDTIEYCLALTFSDRDTTHLGTTNNGLGNVKYALLSDAQAHPFSFTYAAGPANLGNCWHFPYNYEPVGTYMRNPRYPLTNNAVYIYNGNQFQGAGNPGDQSGGTLYYRAPPAETWSSAALAFDSELENNKYWFAQIPAGSFPAAATVEYCLQATYADHDTTWLGTTNNTGSQPYASEAEAKAHPFSFTYTGQSGTEAGFIWHASNRVSMGSGSVQFWAKMGYCDGSGNNRWVDNAVIYYTTNGATPAGAKGVAGNADTLVQVMGFDHVEEDSSENGEAMWWVGTVSGLSEDQGSTVKYKIGAWKGAGVERFAEYNTSDQDNKVFEFSLYVAGAAGLTINGKNADYTTTKFFIDEIAGQRDQVVVVYTPEDGVVSNVQVFCNLDRRDLCEVDYTNQYISADGYPDGIRPPEGNFIGTSDTGAYFTAFAMSGGPVSWYWTGTVSKCGAYRLTARYQKSATGPTDWKWYSSNGRRDHAIVVSPEKAHDLTMYELNTLTVKAGDDTQAGRSTFADLTTGNPDSFTNFNLGYLNKLQANCLWFQPIHPNGIDRGDGYTPGSPYATRDYFAVSKWFGRDETEDGALREFTNFVQACDTYTGQMGTVNIMLDGVFNHTSWDAEFGTPGVTYGFCTNANDRIGWYKPGWYSYWQDYGSTATFYNTAWDNDIATAPDRGDFGKWNDVAEFYYGKYSALVRHNPDNNGDYLNEDDVYDFTGMVTDTKDLWKYISFYPEFWLRKTGHSGTNSTAADGTYAQRLARDNRGIDGLRCDFGQGLPPQCWEYIINRTRSMKWNFIFMAETLDGGKPGYRSNRHFDVLNENIVFKFTQEHIGNSWEIRQALEDRRTAYSGGGILLNLTGHDEVMPETDPWMTASRYGALSTVDGIPMIFYGQEKGIQPYSVGIDLYKTGFKKFELNFGKYIPDFKQWNKLTVWETPPPDSYGMDQWYGRVNWARHNSPALRTMNRYFLSRTAGGDNARIFAVAKYAQPYASPASNDVVLAFALVLNSTHDEASDTYDLKGCFNVLGLDLAKSYRVRNLAASDAYAYLPGWPQTGQQLWDNGIYVHLTSDKNGHTITDDGSLVQYLKLEEVTGSTNRGPSLVFNPSGPFVLPVGSTTNFAVTATDPDGNAVTTNLVAAPAGATWENGVLSWTAPSSAENTTNYVVFTADDHQGLTNSVVTNATTIAVPYDWNNNGIGDGWEWDNFGNLTNTAVGDNDNDYVDNHDEYLAHTQPTNPNSFFAVTNVLPPPAGVGRSISIPTQPGRRYQIYYSDGSLVSPQPWHSFGNGGNGVGTWRETNVSPASFTFRDDETADTTTNAPLNGIRHYRIGVGP